MSTRALYTFRDEDGTAYNVYKHHDGYPTGAARVIRDAINYYAWPLPRFEADEFAAAFCAAGKSAFGEYLETLKTHRNRRGALSNAIAWHTLTPTRGGGGVRLMPQGEPDGVASKHCCDIEYRYEVMMGRGNHKLIIKVVAWSEIAHNRRTIFYGPFEDFERGAKVLDCAPVDYTIYTRPPGEGKPGTRKLQPEELQHVSTGNVA